MRTLLAALAVAALAVRAAAFNTETQNDELGWRAAYLGNARADGLPFAGWTRNEHTELTHVILRELGAGCFGIDPRGSGGCGLTVVDLNAALFQPGLGTGAREGDDAATPLEERWVPPPAHFAGLPDYSWALHDWINKNTLCPPLPPDAPYRSLCNNFLGWLGALNANHFGTQARHMYARYHRIALGLAQRARALRESLAAAGAAADYAEFTREAELEALIFESVGQHFLQDRWSSGHMWERWNGADYAQTRQVPFEVNVFVAAAAGLLHGSEGITKLPDPLSSPVVTSRALGNRADPVRWRLPGLAPLPGLGDYRIADMYDGFFGIEFGFGDLPIDVTAQRGRMIACAKAGWSEVIRAFGEREPGRFGEYGVALAEGPFPPVLEDERCWEAWATNAAIAAGWLEHPSLLDIEKTARTGGVLKAGIVGVLRARLAPQVETTWRIRANQLFGDPDATTLAQGEIGSIVTIGPGNAYAFTAAEPGGPRAPRLPDYTEPENLDTLPERDPAARGHDKQSIFGFFNRAHADHWCTNDLTARLRNLRGTGDPVREAACAYLADRVYQGTDPAYAGKRRERRRVGEREVAPICRLFGVETAGVEEDVPFYLRPGYVTNPGARGPYTYDSLTAWCRKVAVVDTGPCPGQRPGSNDDAWDVAGRVMAAGGDVPLRGRHFGDAPGEVLAAGTPGGSAPVRIPVVSWSDTEILLSVPPDLLADGDWSLQVCPAGDAARCSIGRAILRVGDALCAPPELPGLWTLRKKDGSRDIAASFWLLENGAVMVSTGRRRWAKAATWSAVGDQITIDPCPLGIIPFTYDYLAPSFRGRWSARPITDRFEITSCPAPNEDSCPAMSGFLRLVTLRDGTEFFSGEVDSSRGLSLQRNYMPFAVRSVPPTAFDAATCQSGVCREIFGYTWPHDCAPELPILPPPATPLLPCGDVNRFLGPPGNLTCPANGLCPRGFTCEQVDTFGCLCVEDPPQSCTPAAPVCEADMFCSRSGLCVHTAR